MTANELIKNVWEQETVVIPANELPEANYDAEGIILHREGNKVELTRKNRVYTKSFKHEYRMPEFAGKVKALLQKSLNGERSCNLLFYGAMGTGKTEFVNEIAREMGFAKVYHVNGIEEMDESAFYGRFTVKIDPKTGNNYTPFEKGSLYRAFIEGTELDENGDQVLYDKDGNVTKDPSGNPKVIGKPAIFFLDEFATIRPEVFLGVFNRALEIPRNPGESRSIEITAENGKTVKSHPGLVMIFAGNTNGTGNCGEYQANYTAQTNRMDASTLNRMTAKYMFGYNRIAEQEIAEVKLQDDFQVDNLMKFRDTARRMFKDDGKVETLFSTRNVIEICECAKSYREGGIKNWMLEAVRDCFYNGLSEQDKPAFNEIARMVWGKDLVSSQNADYDYI
ncbi:MAG: AAA family ATPase [Alphaproteobacteria bacterium]|nr:AAA family ATPase [Alphaproteobacteria bacterium]